MNRKGKTTWKYFPSPLLLAFWRHVKGTSLAQRFCRSASLQGTVIVTGLESCCYFLPSPDLGCEWRLKAKSNSAPFLCSQPARFASHTCQSWAPSWYIFHITTFPTLLLCMRFLLELAPRISDFRFSHLKSRCSMYRWKKSLSLGQRRQQRPSLRPVAPCRG